MDDDIPIPVTTVSQITGVPYLDVIKHVEAMAEAMTDVDPWVRYLGDERGAVRPSVAQAFITSVSLERASASESAPVAAEETPDAAQ